MDVSKKTKACHRTRRQSQADQNDVSESTATRGLVNRIAWRGVYQRNRCSSGLSDHALNDDDHAHAMHNSGNTGNADRCLIAHPPPSSERLSHVQF
jgi:hypothetical protein